MVSRPSTAVNEQSGKNMIRLSTGSRKKNTAKKRHVRRKLEPPIEIWVHEVKDEHRKNGEGTEGCKQKQELNKAGERTQYPRREAWWRLKRGQKAIRLETSTRSESKIVSARKAQKYKSKRTLCHRKWCGFCRPQRY